MDDQVEEPDGSITVTVLAGEGYTVAMDSSDRASIIVTGNEGYKNVAIHAISTIVDEGNDAYFTVQSSVAPSQDLTVNIQVSDGNYDILADDPPSQVFIKAGTFTTNFVVKTVADDVDEPAGRITVLLLGRSNGPLYTIDYQYVSAFVTVRDRLTPLLPLISISANSDSVVEGNDIEFTISSATIAPKSDLDIGIFIREKGEFLSQKLEKFTLDPGELSDQFTLNTINDNIPEFDGEILVIALPGVGYRVDENQSRVSVAVTDNDTGTPTNIKPKLLISAPYQNIIEGEFAQFTLVSDRQMTVDLTVYLNVDQDGSFLSSTPAIRYTFPQREYSVNVNLMTTNDNVPEHDGRITATIIPSPTYEIVDGEESDGIQVADNDAPLPLFLIAKTRNFVVEGNNAEFAIGSETVAAVVALDINLLVEQDGDFLVNTNINKFTMSEGKGFGQLDLPTIDDQVREENGMVRVTILPGEGYEVFQSHSSDSIQIRDNEPLKPLISIHPKKRFIDEGETARFVIESTQITPTTDLEINIELGQVGSFLVDTTKHSFTLGQGKELDYLDIRTVDDQIWEADGYVYVDLQSGTDYYVNSSDSSAVIDVLDNDPELPHIIIAASHISITEGDPALFTLASETDAPVTPLEINIDVVQVGSFLASSIPNTFTLQQGKFVDQLRLPTIDDNVQTANGSITVSIEPNSGYTVIDSYSQATVSILDNDDVEISVEMVSNQKVRLNLSQVELIFRANPSPAVDTVINYMYKINNEVGDRLLEGGIPIFNPDLLGKVILRANESEVRHRLTAYTIQSTTSINTVTINSGLHYQVAPSPQNRVEFGVVPHSLPRIELLGVNNKNYGGSFFTEGDTMVFILRSSSAPKQNLLVNLDFNDEDSNILPSSIPSTVILPAGSYQQRFEIVTVEDQLIEPNSKITATILPGIGYLPHERNSVEARISDDDGRVVEVRSRSNVVRINEGDVAEFEIRTNRLGTNTQPQFTISVEYTVDDGDHDFILQTPTSPAILTGTRFAWQLISVSTNDDSVDEENGEISINILPGAGYRLGVNTSASIMVFDNDDIDERPYISIEADQETITEGETAVYRIHTTRASQQDLAINLSSSVFWLNVHRNFPDFGTSIPSVVKLPAGSTEQEFEIQTDDDLIYEPNGRISIWIDNGENYSPHWHNSRAEVTIVNNDKPVISIHSDLRVANELRFWNAATNSNALWFWLRADIERQEDLPIHIQVVEESTNFLREPFAEHQVWGKAVKPGYSIQTLSRNLDEVGFYPYLLQNNIDEPDGRLIVSVLSNSNYTVSPTHGSSTIILEDDDVPSVSFSSYNQNIVEGEPVTLNIQSSIASWRNLEINVEADDRETGSLASAPQKAIIRAGEMNTSITIQSFDDSVDEASGFIILSLLAGHGYQPSERDRSRIIVVRDNDSSLTGPMIEITALENSVTEGQFARFRVNLSHSVSQDLTVNLAIDNDRTNNELYLTNIRIDPDFRNTNYMSSMRDQATIEAGQQEKIFQLTLHDDQIVRDETVYVRLVSGEGYSLSTRASGKYNVARVNVLDNDKPTISIRAVENTITEADDARFILSSNLATTTDLDVSINLTRAGIYGGGSYDYNRNQTVTIKSGERELELNYSLDTNLEIANEVEEVLVYRIQIQTDDHYSVSTTNGLAQVSVLDDDEIIISVADVPPLIWGNTTGAPRAVQEGSRLKQKIYSNIPADHNLSIRIEVTDWGGNHLHSFPNTVELLAGQQEQIFYVQTKLDGTWKTRGLITTKLLPGDNYEISRNANSFSLTIIVDRQEDLQIGQHSQRNVDIFPGSREFFPQTILGGIDVTPYEEPFTVSVEEGQPARFTLMSRGNNYQDSNVELYVSDNGTGYLLSAPSSIMFYKGYQVTEFEVQTRDNSIQEDDGVIAAYVILNNDTDPHGTVAFVVVKDNDGPEISVSAISNSVVEGSMARFRLNTATALTKEINVEIIVNDGGRGFIEPVSRIINLPIGTSEKIIDIQTIGDTADEASGSITFEIQSGDGYNVSTSAGHANVVVLDDDTGVSGPTISIETITSTIVEGGIAQLRVKSDIVPVGELPISLSINNENDDFVQTRVEIFPLNSEVEKIFNLQTIGDSIDELDGVISVQIMPEENYSISSTKGTAQFSVLDDDQPEISLSTVRDFVLEGKRAWFKLNSEIAPAQDLSINILVDDDSEGLIALPKPQMITFEAGLKEYEFGVQTADDTEDEASGWFNVKILSGNDYTVSIVKNSARVQIFDDDNGSIGPNISIEAVTDTIVEGNVATFKLISHVPFTGTLTINLEIDDGDDDIIQSRPTTAMMNSLNTEHTFVVRTGSNVVEEEGGVISAKIVAGTGYSVSITQGRTSVAVTNSSNFVTLPVVSLTVSSLAIVEGETVTVTFNSSIVAPTGGLAIKYQKTQTGDFFVSTFSGNTTKVIPVNLTFTTENFTTENDFVDEIDGSFTISILSDVSYERGSAKSVVVTVSDDDALPVFSVATVATPVVETGLAQFRLTSPTASSTSLTIRIRIAQTGNVLDGSAGDTTTSILAGIREKIIDISTEEDLVDEPDGVITMTLLDDNNQLATYALNSDSSRITASISVNDNDALPVFSIAAVATPVVETGPAQFRLISPTASSSPLTIRIRIAQTGNVLDGSAGDTTRIVPALRRENVVEVLTRSDLNDELDGVITMTLLADNNQPVTYALNSDSSRISASISVIDNEALPVFSIAAVVTPVAETGPAQFMLTSPTASSSPLTIRIRIAQTGNVLDGSAGDTTTSISAGVREKIIDISTEEDLVDEPDGVITMTLLTDNNQPATYVLNSDSSRISASISVNDNDALPEFSIVAVATPVVETGPAQFRLTSPTASSSLLTIRIRVAQAGNVLEGLVGDTTISISAGVREKVIDISTEEDLVDEPDGYITMTLLTDNNQPATYVLNSDSSLTSAKITVSDNDEVDDVKPVVSIKSMVDVINEGEESKFVVNLTLNVTKELEVKVVINQTGNVIIGGSRIESVRIAVGNSTNSLAVQTDEDDLDEPDCWITATILASNDARYFTNTSVNASVLVRDNDQPRISIAPVSTQPVIEGEDAKFEVRAIDQATDTKLNIYINLRQEEGDFLTWRIPRSVILNENEQVVILSLVTIDDDKINQGVGKFVADILPGFGYQLGRLTTASVFVQNNDEIQQLEPSIEPRISISDIAVESILANISQNILVSENMPEISILADVEEVSEGQPVRFEIHSNQILESNLEVGILVEGSGTLIRGEPSTTVILHSGTNVGELMLNTVDDNETELDEMITARLIDQPHYNISVQSNSAVVRVLDFFDWQQQAQLSQANSEVIPEILDQISAFSLNSIEQRIDQEFAENGSNIIQIGGKNTLTEILTESGRTLNEDVLVTDFIRQNSSFALNLNSDSNLAKSSVIWGASKRNEFNLINSGDTTLNGELLASQFGLDLTLNQVLLAGVTGAFFDVHADYIDVDSNTLKYRSESTGYFPYFGWQSRNTNDKLFLATGIGTGTVSVLQDEHNWAFFPSRLFSTELNGQLQLSSIIDSNNQDPSGVSIDSSIRMNQYDIKNNERVAGKFQQRNVQARIALENKFSKALVNGSRLKPNFSAGLQIRSEDQENEFGYEFNSGLTFADPKGLSVSVVGNSFIMSNYQAGYLDFQSRLEFDSNHDDLGLQLDFESLWKSNSFSNSESIFNSAIFNKEVDLQQTIASNRVDAELGYGFKILDDVGIVTPYKNINWENNNLQQIQFGSKISIGPDFSFDLVGSRKIVANSDIFHQIEFSGNLRW